jgi:nicotinic acid mononucleotide adenylyltransferase
MKFYCLIFILVSHGVLAHKLTDEQMTRCKSIAIVAGTYDPFTNGHEDLGKAIRSSLPFDCVVFLPTQDPPHKIASPFQTRYEMLEAALKDEPGLFYPSQDDLKLSPKDYVSKMRNLSSDKKVFAVLGSDLSDKNYMYYINKFRLDPDGYIIAGRGDDPVVAKAFKNKPFHVVHPENSTSSTKARNWFVERPQTYFKPGIPSNELPNNIIREEVSRYIIDNGLYLGTDGVTTRGPGRILKTAFTSGLNKVGLFHPLREVMVNKHKQDQLTEIVVDGKSFPLKKHLGSGLTADAYIFNYDGQDMVVKIANQRPNSPASIKQDVLIGSWLNEKTSIKVPEVAFMDPEGKFKITTKIGGESLGEYLKRLNGVLEPSVEAQLRSAVDDMIKISKRTNIKLDLSVDNLKIWNGKVYLIDAGPIPADVKHPMSFNEFAKTWGSHSKLAIKSHCSFALKGLLSELQN